MKTWFLDLESFYSQEYSLRRMTPVEYILDPRWELIGIAAKEDLTGKPFWVPGEDAAKFFKDIGTEVATVSHNALFDACAFSWRYGYVPKLLVDTLGVSRACLGAKLKSMSLASVSQHLGLGMKGGTVHKVIGMSAAAIKAAGIYDEYVAYSMNDVELCAGIYEKLVVSGEFPMSELLVMDNVLRCAVEPAFRLDQTVLAEHLHAIRAQKDHMLAQAMLAGADGKTDLMSNEKFAGLLRSHGVEPPTKISPVTGRTAYAFSKTDAAFVELADHENPTVQTLVSARLGHKSTLEESRTETFLNISNLAWPGNEQCMMPVPLQFSGAHTHRLSGTHGVNLQNLPARGGNNAIRRALIAPSDHSIFAVDASQIEARIVAWICGQNDLVEAFARGEDVYSMFASDVVGYPVNKKHHPLERTIYGKIPILGLGFGVGWQKFQNTVKLQSKAFGQTIELPDEQAQGVVTTYRSKYSMIPLTWRRLNEAIYVLAGNGDDFRLGPCVFSKGEILLPNGMKLYYPDLRQEDNEWHFTLGGKPKRIYGGALLENIVQALARIVVMDAGVRIRKRAAKFNLQVHDELVYIVRNEKFHSLREIALEEMHRRPTWAPGLPLAAEGNEEPATSYGDAK